MPGDTANKRPLRLRRLHEALIIDAHARGELQGEIAARFGVTQQTISFVVRRFERRLSQQNEATLQERRNKARARHEAWLRWAKQKIEEYEGTTEVTTTRQRRRGLQGVSITGDVPVDATTEASRRTERQPPLAHLVAFVDSQLTALDKIDGVYAAEPPSGSVTHVTEVWYETAPVAPERARLVIIGNTAQEALPEPCDEPAS